MKGIAARATGVLKQNWYLFAILAAVLAVAAGMALFGPSDDEASETEIAVPEEVIDALALAEHPGPINPPRSVSDKAQEAIDKYEEEFRENPEAEDTPLRLTRLGNLYFQGKGDFEKASMYYEMVVQRYPDYEKVQAIYPILSSCYERTGRYDLARDIYRRMLETFPSDSKEYEFAQKKLDDPQFQPGR